MMRLCSDFLDVALDLNRLWEGASAVNQLALVVSESGHLGHGITELAGPFALVVDKSAEFLSDNWVDGELGIRWEDENVGWGVGGFAVVLYVPNTGGRVLSLTSLSWVDTELLGGAVGTEDSSKVNSTVALSLEKRIEISCWSVDVGQTVGDTSGFGVFAANQSWDDWSTRAGDDGVEAREVDHVSDRHTIFGSHSNKVGDDWGQSTVLTTGQFELEGSITTVGETQLSAPCTTVVEDGSDGSTSIVIAETIRTEVLGGQIGGDLGPDSWT